MPAITIVVRAPRSVLFGALMLTIALASVGLAASLTAGSDSLAAARVATPRCTATGLLVAPNLSGANVASVTVSALPAACGSATIQAAVNNGLTSSSGSATVPVGGGSVTVTLAIAVAATTGEQVDVVMIGP